MKILAFDCSAKAGSVALCEDEHLLGCSLFDAGRTHSEILLPMTEQLLQGLKLTIRDIDALAVTHGPGSFTGLRIGVATVKGLAFGGDIPCVGVSTLEALAQNLMPLDGLFCPVMDARRSEVYTALFQGKNGVLTRLTEDGAMPLSLLKDKLIAQNQPFYLVGDGYTVAKNYFTDFSDVMPTILPTPSFLRTQNAFSVALCALRALHLGESVSHASLSPVYLRLPQAERERLEKEQVER